MSEKSIRLRRGTVADWTAANPVLDLAEIGIEFDDGLQVSKLKVGNGTDAWADLPYFAAGVGLVTADVVTDLGTTSLVAGEHLTKTFADGVITLNVDATDLSTKAHNHAAWYQPLSVTLNEVAAGDNGAILAAITAAFTTADEAKLDGIEPLADVTDTENVTAAGALMDTEVDQDIKTLSLPANTTISAFGASLVDDATATAARATLGLGTAATTAATAYDPAGSAAAAQAASQPLDSDLTAIAALTTTAYGRALLELANQAALMALLPAASDTTPGKVELATSAETLTGTDTLRATHPAGVKAAITAAVASLLDSAPGALDTLNELAAALGDDPNFAATMTAALAGKQPLDATLTALAGTIVAADQLVYSTGADAFAVTGLTAYARSLLNDADALTARTTLGAAPLDSPTFTGIVAVPSAATDAAALNLGQADGRYIQHVESALPPTSPDYGHLWLMLPDSHVAMYTPIGWVPVYPPTDNDAVVAGNAFLGIDGLWVAGDGT